VDHYPAFFFLPRVGVFESMAELDGDVGYDVGREAPLGFAPSQKDAQIHPFDELECQEMGPLCDAEIQDLHDVGVPESSRDPRFREEKLQELLVVFEGGQDPLDAHILLKTTRPALESGKSLRHSSRPKAVGKLVRPELSECGSHLKRGNLA
jgi:hypothetical protein